jgi:hypothetical protein
MEESVTTSPRDRVRGYARIKRNILIALLLYVACLGGIGVFLPENPSVDRLLFVLGIPTLFVLLAWCHCDARERCYEMSMPMRICLVLLFAVAFPIYVFKSRGLGGFKAIGLAILFTCAMAVTAIVASIACAGIGIALGIME